MKRYKLSPKMGMGFWGGFAARMMFQRDDLRRENKRLREALEFYATHENHHTKWYNAPSKVGNDFGKIARQALGGDTK